MSEQAKPTEGPVEISSYLHGLYKVDIVADGGRKVVATVTVKDVPAHRDLPPPDNPEGWTNAHLVADAFNVHHETGLTPRELWENVQSKDHVIMDQGQQIHHLHEQLAEQDRHLAELLEIADAAVRALASDICNLVPDEDLQRWQAAIAKARGGSDA